MVTSSTAIRVARVAVSMMAAGCVATWMWIRETPSSAIAAAAVLLAVASLLHGTGRRALAIIGDLLLLALASHALYRFHRPDDWRKGVPAGEQHWSRLPDTTGAHALLAISVLCVFGYLVVVFAPKVVKLIEPLARRVTAHALVLNAGLVAVAFCAADLYCIDRGTPFSPARARFHPFLAYNIPDTYIYRHASERIVKDTRGIGFQQKKPQGTIRVVLAGASTVWGHELPTEDSLSRTLQGALDRRYPLDHYEVVVVAFPGKYQLNELIDATVTLPHWNPDLVISLNGWNEAQYGEELDHYEGMPYIAPELSATLETDSLEAWWYQNTFFGSFLWKHSLRGRAGARASYAEDPAPYEPPRYYDYLQSTARNLREAGIPYAYAFCPNVHEMPGHRPEGWGGPRDPDVWTRERRKAAREIVEHERQISYDVMRALGVSRAEELFVDECHFNPLGTRKLAEDLAEKIPGWIAAWKPPLDR